MLLFLWLFGSLLTNVDGDLLYLYAVALRIDGVRLCKHGNYFVQLVIGTIFGRNSPFSISKINLQTFTKTYRQNKSFFKRALQCVTPQFVSQNALSNAISLIFI